MKEYLDYDQKYPDLIVRLVQFFKNNSKGEKKIWEFCESYKVPKGEDIIQPIVVGKICDRLWERSLLYCINRGLGIRANDSFASLGVDQEVYEKYPDVINHRFNSIVYGFEYIYTHYKDKIIPVVVKSDGDYAMGTCFRIYNGIATARHCLPEGRLVGIRGYKNSQLQSLNVYVSKNPGIDLAFIETKESFIFNEGTPHVLDNVLVMGYPKVASFLDFCAVEKANISAMADLRMTPTFGSIAAEGEMYMAKDLPKLLLVTAKMRGGNSGGPVINEEGYVVGIATGLPDGQGYSDDHVGYGIAYPIQALNEMLKEQNKVHIDFMDFPFDE